MYNKRLLIVEEFVHVTLDEFFPINVREDIYFHDTGASTDDILKDTEEGTDKPKSVKFEEEGEEEDDEHENEKNEN